jgi:hypothetical protein
MTKRLAAVLSVVATLTVVGVATVPTSLAANTSKMTGSITGPYSSGTGLGPVAPALGAHLTFDVTYTGFKSFVAPYVYAACSQNGIQVYGELKPASAGVADFPHFGYDSMWSTTGGAANCTVSLVAYAGLSHGGTIAWLDSVSFSASG